MWPLDEYYAVRWVLSNTAEMSVEFEHRVYLKRARQKMALHFNQCNSDDEKRAIAAALTYHIELCEAIIHGYTPRHRAVREQKARIELYTKARKRILSSIRK